jgi:hypothetical protein
VKGDDYQIAIQGGVDSTFIQGVKVLIIYKGSLNWRKIPQIIVDPTILRLENYSPLYTAKGVWCVLE